MRKKRCNACGLFKPWVDFYAKRKWPDGTMRQPHSRCKSCQRDATRERLKLDRAADPQKYARYEARKYRAIKRDADRYEDHLERSRRAHARSRRERGAPLRPLCSSRHRAALACVPELVPVAPFREWLEYLKARDRIGSTELAWKLGLPDALRNYLRPGGRDQVSVAVVETAILNEGSIMLRDLYPDLYAEKAA